MPPIAMNPSVAPSSSSSVGRLEHGTTDSAHPKEEEISATTPSKRYAATASANGSKADNLKMESAAVTHPMNVSSSPVRETTTATAAAADVSLSNAESGIASSYHNRNDGKQCHGQHSGHKAPPQAVAEARPASLLANSHHHRDPSHQGGRTTSSSCAASQRRQHNGVQPSRTHNATRHGVVNGSQTPPASAAPSAAAPGAASPPFSTTSSRMTTPLNVARLCGWSTSRCGYCRGARAHLLRRDERTGSIAPTREASHVTGVDDTQRRGVEAPKPRRSDSNGNVMKNDRERRINEAATQKKLSSKLDISPPNFDQRSASNNRATRNGQFVPRDDSSSSNDDEKGNHEMVENGAVASQASSPTSRSSSSTCANTKPMNYDASPSSPMFDRRRRQRLTHAKHPGSSATDTHGIRPPASSSSVGPLSSNPARGTTSDSETEVKESNSSRSYGVLFERLSCIDYQCLIDRGWRRSGRHLYLPDNWSSCCPAIPIRLDVTQFQMDRTQRKVWRNMKRALNADTRRNGKEGDHSKDGSAAMTGGSGTRVVNNDSRPPATMGSCNNGKKQKTGPNFRRLGTGVGSGATVRDCCRVDDNDLSPCHRRAASHRTGAAMNENDLDNIRKVLEEQLAAVVWEILQEEGIDIGNFDIDVDSLCRLKVQKNYFKKQDKGKERVADSKHAQDHGNEMVRSVTYFTTVCAAIGGRSRGQVEISTLADHVSARCRQKWLDDDSRCSDSSHHLSDSSMDDDGWMRRILNVESLSTGHLNITLAEPLGITSDPDDHADDHNSSPTLASGTGGHLSPSQSPAIPTMDHLATALGLPSGRAHTLTVQSIPSEISSTQPEVHRLFAKYQEAVHGDDNPYDDVDADTDKRDFMKWIYARQDRIDKARRSFVRFLVDSPLPSVSPARKVDADSKTFTFDEDGYDVHVPYGSYHQQYRIDGTLIAVGVVDVLPHCLSSVYSFYDPDLSGVTSSSPLKLSLGKYTALREIEWVRRASAFRPELRYYYLGFYIHSCPKMKYKAEYKPSCLLCPTYGTWVDFEEAKQLLEAARPHHCCTLDCDGPTNEADEPEESEGVSNEEDASFLKDIVEKMYLDIDRHQAGSSPPLHLPQVTVGMLNSYGRRILDPLVEQFVKAVGMPLSQRCIIKL